MSKRLSITISGNIEETFDELCEAQELSRSEACYIFFARGLEAAWEEVTNE